MAGYISTSTRTVTAVAAPTALAIGTDKITPNQCGMAIQQFIAANPALR